MTLQARLPRLASPMPAPPADRAANGNPLVPQLNRLKAAFEQ
jgi:regulator of CtrA degradation